ncbi:MAG: sigma-70 family RNA polymerase sigma factor [Planctomycetota bacterium]
MQRFFTGLPQRDKMDGMLGQTTTHASLLARLSVGADKGAWAEFFDRYAELIRSFARRQGVQAAECDDVLQDVLVALSSAMPGFVYDPAKGKFRSYLKTATLRVIYRRSCQNKGAVSLENVEALTSAGAVDEAVESQWEAEWRQYHLRLAMKTVSAEFNRTDMQAFEKYGLAGEDVKVTAESLGLSVDQVYQAKSRILRRLGEVIELQVQEEG